MSMGILRSTPRAVKGATLVEFAVVFPIFVVAVLGIVDVARLFAIQAILNKGADEGLAVASTIANLNVDFPGRRIDSSDYVSFREARFRATDAAVRLPRDTLLGGFNSSASAHLLEVRYADSGLRKNNPATPDPTASTSAAVIRPGDSPSVIYPDGSAVVIQHPSLPVIAAGTRLDDLFEHHPIRVEVWASVTPLLPFIGPKILRGVATGFRERVPRGRFGVLDPRTIAYVGYNPPGAARTTTTSTSTTTSTTWPFQCTPNWPLCMDIGGCPKLRPFPGECRCEPC